MTGNHYFARRRPRIPKDEIMRYYGSIKHDEEELTDDND
jgi:hypothetical protein